MQKTKFKVITLAIIGIILLIVGLIFIHVNFPFPNTTLTKVSLAEMENFHFNGYPPETLQQSADNIYRSINADNISKGQILEASWSSDLILGVFVFSEEQFAIFQFVLPNMQDTGNTPSAVEWAAKNGVSYEAIGWAREGEINYEALKTSNYVIVITNAMYGAAYATIWNFNANRIS
jgi:hypothetical protein